MWLMIDDQRNLNCELEARTSAEGKTLLQKWAGQIDCLCLDHDLGEEQETGYDIAKWALHQGLMPARVQIVSSNPVGRRNIGLALIGAGYVTKDGINFKKGL